MTSGAIAAMLSTILYSRRFFPYYVYNIIGGLDEEGRYFNTAVKAALMYPLASDDTLIWHTLTCFTCAQYKT